jgi:hypothetical protein
MRKYCVEGLDRVLQQEPTPLQGRPSNDQDRVAQQTNSVAIGRGRSGVTTSRRVHTFQGKVSDLVHPQPLAGRRRDCPDISENSLKTKSFHNPIDDAPSRG